MGNTECCLSDNTERQVEVPSTTEEKDDAFSGVPAKGDQTLVQQVPATSDESPPAVGEQSPAAATSIGEMSPATTRDQSREMKDAEVKQKLGVSSPKKGKHTQALVRDFVKGMLPGHMVTLLTYTSGTSSDGELSRSEGVMKLDKSIQTLALTCKDGNIVCPLDKIQDVYHIEGDGKEVFPEKVIENLSEEELARLLMVFYKLEDGSKKAFLMLEATSEGRGQFHQCVKILSAHLLREKGKSTSGVEMSPEKA